MSRNTTWAAASLIVVVMLVLPGCNALHQLTLSVSPLEGGDIVVEPKQSIYFAGTEITVTAVPSEGWEFRNWIGPGLNVKENPTSFRIFTDQNVTAVFVLKGDDPDEGELPPVPSPIVADGAFEASAAASPWTGVSTSGRPIICSMSACGTLNGLGPASGNRWAWFGNDTVTASEYATLMQEVNMPPHSRATLRFNVAIPVADVPFNLAVFLGPFPVWGLTEADANNYAGYEVAEINVTGLVQDTSAVLSFVYAGDGVRSDQSAVFIDNVTIDVE